LSVLDVRDGKRVTVLGAETARAMLGDPLGQLVRLGADWYQVIGVLEERSSPRARGNPIRARDLNRAALVPLTSQAPAPGQSADAIDEIAVRVTTGDAVAPAAEVTRRVLKRRLPGAELEIVVPREILRQRERTQRIFNVVTGAVAAIGLLVGGIGIMNIMLASVAERTSEIGLRRACGATRRDIASQFLAESSLLTGGGGVLGLLLGVLASLAIQRWAEWPTALSLLMLVAAALLAAGVGIGSGSYPAWRAAQLEPIEALRRE
jgi:putative ABC transport system permease protein